MFENIILGVLVVVGIAIWLIIDYENFCYKNNNK